MDNLHGFAEWAESLGLSEDEPGFGMMLCAWHESRKRCITDIEPLRHIVVEAIREATGCPDIKGRDGLYLTDKILEKARYMMSYNSE